MRRTSAQIVICGAGIAGISAAYHLAVRHGLSDVVLVDERPPLSLTSDKSTECYRNWWPGPGVEMVAFMNRSIDLLEELAETSGNLFHLNRRGYLYLTAQDSRLLEMQASAEEISRLGGGSVRIHRESTGEPAYQPSHPYLYKDQPEGADLLLSADLIQKYYPYITPLAVGGLHARRAGWFSAHQLGIYLLEQAKVYGAEFHRTRLVSLEMRGRRVQSVSLDDGTQIATEHVVDAAGPFVTDISRMLGVELPVVCELHLKASFKDTLGVLPREAPLLIWNDPQELPWSDEECDLLAQDEATRWLLSGLPAGVHTRPDGGADSPIVLMLWEYHAGNRAVVLPPPLDPDYPEIAMRGLTTMIPGLEAYLGRLPKPYLDGGYYTKTRENRPLIGPLPVKGAWVIGALSGYGLMASQAAGELLAAHLLGNSLPGYAAAFDLRRYQDPAYLASLDQRESSGQL